MLDSVNKITTFKNKRYIQSKRSQKIKNNYLFNASINYKRTFISMFYLHVPSAWNILKLTIQNLTIFYLYNSNYYVIIAPNQNHDYIHYDKNYRLIYTNSRLFNGSFSLMNTFSKNTFKFLNLPSFSKIKFKGKGYYVYKGFRNTITPQFNYYHRIYVYSFFTALKFIRKTAIIVFGYTMSDLNKVAYSLKSKRPINIFTGRGVRFARQIVYKKTGKVSSYK